MKTERTVTEQYYAVKIIASDKTLWLSRTANGYLYATPVERLVFPFLTIGAARDAALDAKNYVPVVKAWEILHREVVSKIADEVMETTVNPVDKLAEIDVERGNA
jgi:hypothetical protein